MFNAPDAAIFHAPATTRKSRKQLRIVHSVHRTHAEQLALREVNDPRICEYDRDYLEWYHGDPLKRSLRKAHSHAFNNRSELFASNRCGCFHCGSTFRAGEIKEWMKDSTDSTAFCPRCDIDAVVGDASGYMLSPAFLKAMNARWYN